jgi:hypothetical protein
MSAELPFAIAPDEIAAFNRFCECCEDSGADGHDVPKDQMKRLAEIGLVRPSGFGRHETTAFGDAIRDGKFAPASPANTAAATGEREAFEAWWGEDLDEPMVLIVKHYAWEAWQAARARPALTDEQILGMWATRDCIEAIQAGDLGAQLRVFARAIERHLNGSQP